MTAIQKQQVQIDHEAIERVVAQGDLSKLSPEQRIQFVMAVCKHAGVSPLLQPIEFINFQGRTIPYVKRQFTDQIRAINNISITITDRQQVNDVYMVKAQATTPSGRLDESIGAVSVAGLKGESLANAFMKAETKAKRRVTLAITGLGMLDESELDTMKGYSKDDDLAPKLQASIDGAKNKKSLKALAEEIEIHEVAAVARESVRRQSELPPPIGSVESHVEMDEAPAFDPSDDEPVKTENMMGELDRLTTASQLNAWYARYADYIKVQNADVKEVIRHEYGRKRKALGMTAAKKSSPPVGRPVSQ